MHITIYILLLTLLAPFSALAERQHQGRVVAVHDGDTFTLLEAGNHQSKIRMAEIDTPELGQPYGNKAKQALAHLIFGKNVTVAIQDTDRYGRLVGRVFVDNQDVNAQMVEQGAAWVYLKYLKDKSLLSLQTEAQQAKAGPMETPRTRTHPAMGLATYQIINSRDN